MCVTSHALVRDSLCDKLMFEQRLLREGGRDAALWVELSRPRKELVHSLRWEPRWLFIPLSLSLSYVKMSHELGKELWMGAL